MGENLEKEITKDFLQEVLEKNESTCTIIEQYHSKYALGKGENYLSVVFRVHLLLADKSERHWIIKRLPENERLSKFLEENGMFAREIEFYDKWFPQMLQLYENRKLNSEKETPAIWPRYYKTTKELTLILDDLAPAGFRMFPRHNQMDLNHSLIVIRALARFHVYSMILIEKYPNLNEIISDPFYDKNRTFEKFTIQQFTSFKEVLSTWEGFERFVPILEKMITKIFDLHFYTLKLGKYKALAHSDAWINNFLFNYNDQNQPCDIRLLDFQVMRVASPVIDLQFFVNTSIKHEVWVENSERIFTEYHDTIKIMCNDVQMQVPFTLEELKEEYENAWFWGFSNATTFLPIVLADPEEALNFDGEDEDDDPAVIAIRGKRFGEACRKKLLYFEEVGFLKKLEPLMEYISKQT